MGAAISFIVAATVTVLPGFDKSTAPVTVMPPAPKGAEQLFAPVSGELKALQHFSNPIFADEVFGKGLAIVPTVGELRSPTVGTD